MANHHQDDIDKAFHDRFEGLKDYSVDPASQWVKFEAGMNAPVQSGLSSTGAFSSSMGMAASIVGLIGLAVFTSQDKTALSIPEIERAEQEIAISEEASKHDRTSALWLHEERDEESTESTYEKPAKEAEVSEFNLAQNASSTSAIDSEKTFEESGSIVSVESFQDGGEMEGRSELHSMKVLDLSVDIAGVELRDIPSIAEREEVVYQSTKSLFFRAGARVGNGESNTQVAPSKWRLNGLLSIGYNYTLSAKTSVSIEAGYLVRSGNGVERSRRIDLDPLFSMISSSNGFSHSTIALPSASSIDIRESLVATRMSFIHVPALVHVQVGNHSNASVGCYADYLLSVKNESYMVYNGQDYIGADLDLGTQDTKEGLKAMRLGLVAGYEHSVTERLSGDIRAMLPITSIYDRKSSLYSPKEPNQMVDFQFSLIYKI